MYTPGTLKGANCSSVLVIAFKAHGARASWACITFVVQSAPKVIVQLSSSLIQPKLLCVVQLEIHCMRGFSK